MMLLSTKSPFSVIIYKLNLPVDSNLAETHSPDEHNSISFNFSSDATLFDFLAAVSNSEFSCKVKIKPQTI